MRFASIHCSKMRLRPGLHPEPRWGAYSAPPDSLVVFKGARGGGGRKRKGRREVEGKGRSALQSDGKGRQVGTGLAIG